MSDVFVGLSDLVVEDASFDLGADISLEPCTASFMTPLTLENLDPDVGKQWQKPAYLQFANRPIEITAQLCIKSQNESDIDESIEKASLIVFLIRLWCDPSVTMPVVSNRSLALLSTMESTEGAVVRPLEVDPKYFHLVPANRDGMRKRIEWVRDNWQVAYALYKNSQEFRIAADAMNGGPFVKNHGLTLISLWGALEALFSPATTELKFRVSALIAAYLEPPGEARLQKQREIASLYDKRSAAAHGKPRHSTDDLFQTFVLVRTVLIKMIQRNNVPSKESLERLLFGANS